MTIINDTDKAARERRIMFSYYHQQHRTLEAQRKALSEQIKSVKQNAKASGFPSAKLDHYLKAFNAEDEQKPVDKFRSERENLEWLGYIPATSGGDLLKQGDRVDGEQMIQAKGFHAGLNNLDRVSGYSGGSVDDKLWLESYDAGKAEYDAEIPDIMARIQAAATNEEPPADPGDEDPFAGASIIQ